MSRVAIILLIMITCLNVIPCTDGMKGDTCTENIVDHATEHRHNDRHSEEEDTCSPFCACVCCHISIAITLESCGNQIPMTESRDKKYSHQPMQGISHAVWHPPKLT